MIQYIIILVVLIALKIYLNGGTNNATKNLENKTILVTGCNTGIGLETAKVLSKLGAHIILACRNLKSANDAKETVHQHSKNDKLTVVELDLSSLKSIAACVQKLKELNVVIDILINNAGVMMCPYMKTVDGFENQMGTNHIGHFYFTLLLLDANMINKEDGRIINVSSRAHIRAKGYDPNNLFMTEDKYSMTNAYSHSKLSNILFSIELQRRFDERKINIVTCSLHPGVVNTELARHIVSNAFLRTLQKLLFPIIAYFMKSPLQGAQTTLYCAMGPLEKGAYYSDCKVKEAKLPEKYEEVAKNLWIKSEETIKYQCKSLKD